MSSMAAKASPTAMQLLAQALAQNYFCTTVGYHKREDVKFRALFDKVCQGYSLPPGGMPRSRNIVVVGAGMSYGCFGGKEFPMARAAIDRIRTSLGTDALEAVLSERMASASQLGNKWAEEKELLTSIMRVAGDDLDFESHLSLLGQFYTQHQVRHAIAEIYDKRYWPHIATETLSHLLKHRFVDVIINYNFDEMLDQAIAEEVRGGDYRKIISDGDCPRDISELVIGQALKIPLYIKPHGTISHKSTLRFTKRDYFDAPSDLLRFTETILHGYTVNGDAASRLPVNLIAIGFNFTSIELARTLRTHPALTVWHINPTDRRNELLDIFPEKRVTQHFIGVADRTAAPYSSRATTTSRFDDKHASCGDALSVLMDRLVELFREPYRPRHIARHRFVHDVLVSNVCGHTDPCTACPPNVGVRVPMKERSHLRARVNVELAIAISKGRGRIDLATLVHDRVGIYFKAWREAEDKRFEDERDRSSLRDFCLAFGLVEDQGFVGNLFRVPNYVEPTESHSPELGDWTWAQLKQALGDLGEEDLTEHIRKDEVQIASKEFLSASGGEARELAPRFNSDELLLVRSWNRRAVIHTNLGMALATEEVVHNAKASLIIAIIENDGVFQKVVNARTSQRRALVSVVVASQQQYHSTRTHAKHDGDGIWPDRYELPYWAHNEHLIVALERGSEPGLWTPLDAIWYRRAGLSNRINPIRVSDSEDLEDLVLTFFGHVRKSTHWRNENSVPDVIRSDAESTREERLLAWWKQAHGVAAAARRKASLVISA